MDGCYEMLAKHSQNETNEKKKMFGFARKYMERIIPNKSFQIWQTKK